MPPHSKLMQTRMSSQAKSRAQSRGGRPPQSAFGGATSFVPQSEYNIAGQPLIYQPTTKQETEDMKIERYERVIEQLKKMVDQVKKQNKNCRMQYEREI